MSAAQLFQRYLWPIGRILAIDYGTKRVGLAVTDPDRMIAFALDTVPNHAVVAYLDKYFQKETVDGLIIGMPVHLDGARQKMTGLVEDFVKHMRRRYKDKWVKPVDERFTSSMAQHTLFTAGTSKKQRHDKGALDRISATIMLQEWLDQEEKGPRL